MKHCKFAQAYLIGSLLFGAAVLTSCNQHAMTAMASDSEQGADSNSAQPDRFGLNDPELDDFIVERFTSTILDPIFRNNPGLTPSSLHERIVGSGNSDVVENQGEFVEKSEESDTTPSTANEEFLDVSEKIGTTTSSSHFEETTTQLEDTSWRLQEVESQGESLGKPEESHTTTSTAKSL